MNLNSFLRIWILFIVAMIATPVAFASHCKHKHKRVSAPINPISSSIIVDGDTGEILHFEKADKLIFPASLTKLMTLYLTFEAIENGKLRLNQYVPVSYEAAHMPPSKLGLRAGEMVKVKDLIMGLIIKSANDASVVLAEAISGGEEMFSRKMTLRAKQLGMYNTLFRNASGWHHNDQRTNAMDLAKLGIALKRDFPLYYPLFSETKFNFQGRTIHTHNHLTKTYKGAHGMKTGYTGPSGFNLVTAATKNGKKLIGVVTGGRSARERDLKMAQLLDKHFGIRTSEYTVSKTFAKKALVKKTAQVKYIKSKRKPRKSLRRITA